MLQFVPIVVKSFIVFCMCVIAALTRKRSTNAFLYFQLQTNPLIPPGYIIINFPVRRELKLLLG